MQINTLVSIVIPAYNRGNLIDSALNSVRSQTYHNWECIIVDDHSTDNTKEVVAEFCRQDSRFIYVLNNRTKGAQGARNSGILAAKGEWIAFNDSDDVWIPEKLGIQLQALAKADYDPYTVIHGNCFIQEASEKKIFWQLPLIEGEKPFNKLLVKSSPMFQSLLSSRKVLLESGLLDEQVPSYQEWDCAIALSRICDFIHLQEPLFIYQKHTGETISKDLVRDLNGVDYINRKYKKDIIDIYGRRRYDSLICSNILRAIAFDQSRYGKQLLSRNKEDISTSNYYLVLFFLNTNFNILRIQHFLSISNIFKFFKRKWLNT